MSTIYWPIIVYILFFIVFTTIMAFAGFHVYRFRYHNDAAGAVFTTFVVMYVLITLLTVVGFHYSATSNGQPDNITSSSL